MKSYVASPKLALYIPIGNLSNCVTNSLTSSTFIWFGKTGIETALSVYSEFSFFISSFTNEFHLSGSQILAVWNS